VYRLTGGRWETMPQLIHARAAGAAVVVDGKIVVVGGRDTQALVDPTEIFDGTRWQEAPPPPVPGDHLAAVTDGTSVYVAGGRALNAANNTAALQQFDLAHNHWTRLRDMPAPHGGLGAVYVNGRIITAGGEDVASVSGNADVYDISAGTWAALPPLPTPRHGLVLAAVGSRIFAIDGATRRNHTGSTDAVEELDLGAASSPTTSPGRTPASPSSSPSPSPSPGTALGEAGVCPGDPVSAVRACLTSATAHDGRLNIAFTVNVKLSTTQDAAHRHLHFYLANPDGHGGTVPDASIMQAMAPNPGTWFNIYSPDVKVIDASTEQGPGPHPLDLKPFSLLCVRVATGAHTLVTDRSGHLRTGNCVTIRRS
jgi:Kelch motif